MKRFAIEFSYDGTNFFGYQGQPNVRTVQGELEKALERIFKERIFTQGAGRTDAGVHANGQVAAFNCPIDRLAAIDIKNALNANLPEDIYVKKAWEVEKNFNPRFRAKKRIYHYLVSTNEKDVFKRNYVWHFKYKLNIEAMRIAARYLEGEHDFSSFKKGNDKKNPIRTVYRIRILNVKKELILIRVEGRSFLRSMVRNIVGSLVRVGLGQWTPEKIKKVLEARSRQEAAGTAPPHGLYLYKVLF
ncbi:tRNA pseudouridine synthase ACD [Thermosipho melanesiensis]|uniref:tRNA pseudouridine synthase A n=2 Tax=Thermosipho melanesiensis TaxID=46541 RepID=TRUA_THEM4|nr:tRNA pseudouridine(38-40) synthase TruA [Thermosipho melanesiensis]A6LLJ7.1 RecName: Full=tRNA pseudouridine synthase A; AltName: Full=tRNA pseudouridine(38-40) synthase; AltName: Full=tRNA pseudouridylate synthase I; AltName: Full=tRNA-uridine isomerase I [Thermosipho melanesiensis BI429]ABR30798.1 tRNA pseudouridine synthase A [Thermosipho melanesiensis BI429]APT73919.1 tRNA pseudouridine synthase ACD [Thermosipho melanesiensis]OOC35857.1 tRNA pseudouridine synthase ACD [Thermosipho melane